MITNNKFGGMLKKMGDEVEFYFPGNVAIHDWVKGQPFVYDEVKDEKYSLIIDRGNQWGFPTHKVDDRQALIKSYGATYRKQATKSFAEFLDVVVFAEMLMGAYVKGDTFGDQAYNFGTYATPLAITKENALQAIVNMDTAAAELDWDIKDTFAVLPPWYFNCIARSDLKDASLVGAGITPLKTGIHSLFQTHVSGITLIPSNLLPKYAASGKVATNILFGTKRAFCLATQIEDMGITNGGKDNPMTDYHWGVYIYGMKQLYRKELGRVSIVPGVDAFAA
jgi:hypothetical protein